MSYAFIIIFALVLAAGPVVSFLIRSNERFALIFNYCLLAVAALILIVAYVLQFPESMLGLSIVLFMLTLLGRIYLLTLS